MSSMGGTRIPMNDDEHAAVDALLEEYGRGSLSRAFPNEEGPVVVKIDGQSFLVADDGSVSDAGNPVSGLG